MNASTQIPKVDSPMAQAIVDLVYTQTGVSFVEVCRKIEGAKGERALVLEKFNIVLWDGLSSECIQVLADLVNSGLIKMKPTDMLVYYIDAEVLSLPVAHHPPENGYKEPHWLPVVLNPGDGIAEPEGKRRNIVKVD